MRAGRAGPSCAARGVNFEPIDGLQLLPRTDAIATANAALSLSLLFFLQLKALIDQHQLCSSAAVFPRCASQFLFFVFCFFFLFKSLKTKLKFIVIIRKGTT